MDFGAGQRLDAGDRRYRGLTTTLSAAGFEGGYHDTIDTSGGAQTREATAMATKTLTNAGDFVIMRGQVRIPASPAWTQAAPIMKFAVSTFGGTLESGACALALSGARYLYLIIRDANGNQTTGVTGDLGDTILSTGTIYTLETLYEKLSSTQLKASVRLNGSLIGSTTHTAAGGVGNPSIMGVEYGGAYNAKLAGYLDFGGIQIAKSGSTITGDWFSDLTNFEGHWVQPDSDPEETGWKTETGATGTYTKWAKAAGAFVTTTYNESLTAAGQETQASGVTTPASLASGETVMGVTMVGIGVGAGNLATCDFIFDDGTEAVGDSLQGASSSISMCTFLTGGSGAITKSTLDAGNVKIRTPSNATNYRCEDLSLFVWSYTAPPVVESPAALAGSGVTHLGLGTGIV